MSIETCIDFYAEQLKLERESVELGKTRYRQILEKKTKFGRGADSGPGHQLVMQALDATAKEIQNFIDSANTGKPGKRHSALRFIREVDPYVLAYLTALTCVNALALRRQKLSIAASALGNEVENELNFSMLHKEYPALHHYIQKQLKKSTSNRYSMKVMRHNVTYALKDVKLELAERDAVMLGTKLIELFQKATGLIHFVTTPYKNGKTFLIIEGDEKIQEWLKEAHEISALFSPVLMPMVTSPKPWTTPTDGGYLRVKGRHTKLVRTRNKAYLQELEQVDMPKVYQAVNVIQATPWKINTPVLDVMKALWEAGGGVAGLIDRELLPLPDYPPLLVSDPEYYMEHHPLEFKSWKIARKKVYEANARSVSKRLATAQKIVLAERFSQYPAIYFPHNLDFRGRAYPIPPMLNPQGDDIAKGLLHFKEGVPLGEDGAYWLAVHVANTFGVDKVSFKDRVSWVREHEDQILDSALDPLDGQRFWIDADSPFCALAACIEWMGYRYHGDTYVSHLPIALDGTCNGLQNFSAMLLDEVGGAATNLVPQEAPADIYTRVRDLAQEKLKMRAETGDEKAIKLDGKLTREIVKRPVMTLPYGVTHSGMRNQILDTLRPIGLDDWGLAVYLSELLWESIGEIVIAARGAMDWLKGAARIASSIKLPLNWTTPAGFVVLQEYRDDDGVKIEPHVGGRRKRVTAARKGTKLNARRQAAGISPNFVHSCDASHMTLTTCLAAENGVNAFAMIHDSFGTHAGQASIMAAALRQAFVEQYQTDVLGDFRNQLIEQLPPRVAKKLPPIPPKGSLDLEQIMDSRYFFA